MGSVGSSVGAGRREVQTLHAVENMKTTAGVA